MDDVRGLILAAGQGTRMKSDLLKVLHPVMGVPMIALVLEALEEAGIDHPAVVVGYQADRVRTVLGDGVDYALQKEQRGTGHAVSEAAHLLEGYRDVLVLYGDVPLVTGETLSRIIRTHRESGAAATLLTAEVEDPSGLGRILRDDRGELVGIVEDADASPAQAAICEINTAIACFRVQPLLECLPRITTRNAQEEYYLPDVFPLLMQEGFGVETVCAADAGPVMGVNTRLGLAEATRLLRHRILEDIMETGVTIVDPDSTWIDAGVRVERDAVIMPHTMLQGQTVIGSRSRIGPSAHLVDAVVGEEAVVWHSVVEDSRIGDGVQVGPYAHLRPGNEIGENVRIGNYAELKNTRVGPGSKIPHHSYLGDAEVGSDVNIGAGTVTVNYDGWEKHQTLIGDGAFVGCNSNLLAPITLGEGSFVAAGSTLDADIPCGALGISRARAAVKKGWVKRRQGLRLRLQGKPAGKDEEKDVE